MAHGRTYGGDIEVILSPLSPHAIPLFSTLSPFVAPALRSVFFIF